MTYLGCSIAEEDGDGSTNRQRCLHSGWAVQVLVCGTRWGMVAVYQLPVPPSSEQPAKNVAAIQPYHGSIWGRERNTPFEHERLGITLKRGRRKSLFFRLEGREERNIDTSRKQKTQVDQNVFLPASRFTCAKIIWGQL